MSTNMPFTKENLDAYLKELGIDDAVSDSDFERIYKAIRENEKQAKDVLLDFDKTRPGELKGANIDAILEQARRKRRKNDREK